ncbi:MAG: hypothetical protein IPM82_06170 [Saprospiraceae bacterium]|nr:hypothetical protein [Saprospiraceae bacterium]
MEKMQVKKSRLMPGAGNAEPVCKINFGPLDIFAFGKYSRLLPPKTIEAKTMLCRSKKPYSGSNLSFVVFGSRVVYYFSKLA